MDRELAFQAAADIEARALPDPDFACVEANRVARAGHASELFKILAHRTRLLVLCQIAERERSVTELERVLGLRQAAISQQLARLRIQGIVSTRRDGRNMFYRLANHDIRDLLRAIPR